MPLDGGANSVKEQSASSLPDLNAGVGSCAHPVESQISCARFENAQNTVEFNRAYVVVLSDWTDEDSETVLSNLKQQSDFYTFYCTRRMTGWFTCAGHCSPPAPARIVCSDRALEAL